MLGADNDKDENLMMMTTTNNATYQVHFLKTTQTVLFDAHCPYSTLNPFYASASVITAPEAFCIIRMSSSVRPDNFVNTISQNLRRCLVTDVFGFIDVLIRFWVKHSMSMSQQAMIRKLGHHHIKL